MKRTPYKMILIALFLNVVILAGCSDETETAISEAAIDHYPNQTIELYVPASPGGQSDAGARVLARHIGRYLDSDFVIVNQDAAGGALAFENVYRAPGDGYKLLYYHQALHTSYAVGQYDYSALEMKPIGTFAGINQVFVTRADAPWDSLEELVEEARERPYEILYGGQIGGTTHFMGEQLGQIAGVDIKVLDVGGESDRMTALLGNQIDFVSTGIGNALNYVNSGDFKALAVLSEERDELAPEIPTALEQGYDVQFPIVHTLYGPADLPDEIVQKWNEATEELAKDEDYIEDLSTTFQTHILMNSEESREFNKEELEKAEIIAQELLKGD
ncbi:tripartite tricarboxylate transporter substrate binding protein [Geomicrobium sp. JCM 19038]|uniref:tripartite tricarboxylate transporter substrate binding protein n=1 Tax=Geomicrobium sp. JCM 19038 TaxID=1460635 RepID=UPI00045F29B1|nr:tripartite tricarboxylate transporter substrate binding protein [Geomicrobium sp. JCM 19038]GAK07985.1 tricarboxylate transport protein TctC [Geomicrobium sp. JCM 19038]